MPYIQDIGIHTSAVLVNKKEDISIKDIILSSIDGGSIHNNFGP